MDSIWGFKKPTAMSWTKSSPEGALCRVSAITRAVGASGRKPASVEVRGGYVLKVIVLQRERMRQEEGPIAVIGGSRRKAER